MNTNLLTQQYQLHFNTDYDLVVSQTVKFIKTVINKPWWGENRSVMLTNEGGMNGMRDTALSHIIEVGEITKGLKAYGNYLRREYGADKVTPISLEILLCVNGEESELDDTFDSDFTESRSVGTQPLAGVSSYSQYDLLHAVSPTRDDSRLEDLQLSPIEREFFETYASVKDIREASALCGISEAEGYRVWRRVKGRAGRIIAKA